MAELVRASLAIDATLMERFDTLVERSGHGNRSEAVRDLIRARLMEDEWDGGGDDAVATVTLSYDHGKRALAREVEDFGHHHHESIISSMHVHLDANTCLEVVVLRGKPAGLRCIADHLMGLKGVNHGQAVFSRVFGLGEDR